MKLIALCVAISISPLVFAAEPNETAKAEIEHLIRHLGSSGCQFNRNGSWYKAPRAVNHLKRKYNYLVDRDLANSAEAFIENAASTSSSSGKPYLVRCNGKPEVESSAWFRAELTAFRLKSRETKPR